MPSDSTEQAAAQTASLSLSLSPDCFSTLQPVQRSLAALCLVTEELRKHVNKTIGPKEPARAPHVLWKSFFKKYGKRMRESGKDGRNQGGGGHK